MSANIHPQRISYVARAYNIANMIGVEWYWILCRDPFSLPILLTIVSLCLEPKTYPNAFRMKDIDWLISV